MQDMRQLPKSEIVSRLTVFYEEQALVNQEQIFGHFQPDIYYPDQTADADQQSQPDDHYFQAQGQEPPPAKKRRWWNNWEANAIFAALAGILGILVACPVW